MNELESFMQVIKSISGIDEKELTPEVIETIKKRIEEQFTPQIVEQSINQTVINMQNQNLTKEEARESCDSLIALVNDLVYGETAYTGNKKVLIDLVVNKLADICNAAVEKYHSYAIELPMTIAPGAKVPTYAHETDAAADLYAMEDQIIDAHSYGNMIKTGVKIQLPEGWLAMILPRSSMGTRTTLRLSNSVGLIDSGYRGELGVLYDNTSDIDCQIHAGDRIAQLLVMPSYRFQAKVVDILADSDRGESGFGASGK